MHVIGNNRFECLFPIVVGNRFFMVETIEKSNLVTVIRLENRNVVVELDKNQPTPDISDCKYEIQKSGFIVVSSQNDNAFFFKIRPKNQIRIIFGKLPGFPKQKNSLELLITDARIISSTGIKVKKVDLINNEIGIFYDLDGNVGIGINGELPWAIVKWVHKYKPQNAHLMPFSSSKFISFRNSI